MQGAVRNVLADNIRTELAKQTFGVNKLADYSSVSRSQTYDVLGSKKGASVDWIDKVAETLGVEPFELLRPKRKLKRAKRRS